MTLIVDVEEMEEEASEVEDSRVGRWYSSQSYGVRVKRCHVSRPLGEEEDEEVGDGDSVIAGHFSPVSLLVSFVACLPIGTLSIQITIFRKPVNLRIPEVLAIFPFFRVLLQGRFDNNALSISCP